MAHYGLWYAGRPPFFPAPEALLGEPGRAEVELLHDDTGERLRVEFKLPLTCFPVSVGIVLGQRPVGWTNVYLRSNGIPDVTEVTD